MDGKKYIIRFNDNGSQTGCTEGTVEYEELISQRAGEIRREIGENKIDQDTALGLARATNETMRSNHYRYMMGDHNAAREAAEAAVAAEAA